MPQFGELSPDITGRAVGSRLRASGSASTCRLPEPTRRQIHAVLDRLDADPLRTAVELAEAIDVVRAYEDVKLDNVRRYLPRVDDLSTLVGISVSRPHALDELTTD